MICSAVCFQQGRHPEPCTRAQRGHCARQPELVEDEGRRATPRNICVTLEFLKQCLPQVVPRKHHGTKGHVGDEGKDH